LTQLDDITFTYSKGDFRLHRALLQIEAWHRAAIIGRSGLDKNDAAASDLRDSVSVRHVA